MKRENRWYALWLLLAIEIVVFGCPRRKAPRALWQVGGHRSRDPQ